MTVKDGSLRRRPLPISWPLVVAAVIGAGAEGAALRRSQLQRQAVAVAAVDNDGHFCDFPGCNLVHSGYLSMPPPPPPPPKANKIVFVTE